MSQDDLSAATQLRFGRRAAYRFDVAPSQVLILGVAVLVLALLLFLSGMAIGLLINPRMTPHGNLRQSAVLPRVAEAPPPQQQTDQRRRDDPPRSRVRLVDEPRSARPVASAESPWPDVVWRPRDAALRQDSTLEPSLRTASAAVGSDADATESSSHTPAPVDSTYTPRPTSGSVQVPSRWRRSQPLAAAYLAMPEDSFVPPPTADPEQRASSDVSASVAESSLPQVSSPEPSPKSPTSASLGDDDGWQPSSSHWQAFVTTLQPAASSDVDDSARSLTALDAGPRAQEISISGRAEDTEEATAAEAHLGWTVADPGTAAISEDLAADADLDEATAEVDGWQPKSNLWRSYLDDPYDWTADRLPAAAPRSAVASGRLGVPYGHLIDAVADTHGVDAALVAAMVRVESAFDANAVSRRGARGLMQVMPATAQRFGVEADQLFDPATNLEVGVRYLRWLQDRFAGNAEHVLAAYNAGENAVDTYEGLPPYAETQDYVERVFTLMGWPRTAAP